MRHIFSVGTAILLFIGSGHAGEIKSVPGTTLSYYVVNPRELPKTAFILFPGGDGVGHVISENGSIKLSKNFLVRTSDVYAKNFTTVIIDSSKGLTDQYRNSPDQARHIQIIIEDLSRRGVNNFFLVGTSRGSLSAASLGAMLSDARIKGIILTASVNKIDYVDLHRIKVPVLFVHHMNDGCRFSSYNEVKKTSQRLSQSTKVTFIDITGGLPAKSDHCQALSPHGFFGVENSATDAIISWARSHM
jgi:hypothetical protein